MCAMIESEILISLCVGVALQGELGAYAMCIEMKLCQRTLDICFQIFTYRTNFFYIA